MFVEYVPDYCRSKSEKPAVFNVVYTNESMMKTKETKSGESEI